MKLKLLKNTDALSVIFLVFVAAVGLFFDYLCALASVILTVYLFFVKRPAVRLNLLSVAAGVTLLFYILGIMWASDRGMAVYGTVRFLPCALFLLCLQNNKTAKANINHHLPCVMAVMTVVSAVGAFIFPKLFAVNGRLSGFLQYPNTFAVLLLVSFILLLTGRRLNAATVTIAAILLAGILYSGSRTVIILTAVASIALIFILKDKKARILIIALISLAVAGTAVLILLDVDAFSRILTTSFRSSTFLGRFLYWQDAAKLILQNPFGIGAYGYDYAQQTVATGIYSVTYAHNGLIELMLDVGWVPAILMYGAFVLPIFAKGTDTATRLILSVLVLHSLFDFDIQFIAVMMLFFVFCDVGGKEYRLPRLTALSVSAVLSAVCVYFGVAQLCHAVGATDACNALYPAHTQNEIVLLTKETDGEKMNERAEHILSLNKNVTVAYSARARYAFSQGDFVSLLKYKEQITEITPFCYEDMKELCYMLMYGIDIYSQSGDDYSAEFCKARLKDTVVTIEEQNSRLSRLGKMIGDKPITDIPEDIREAVK